MDFHILSRKELQTLCKRNKIPANITNVAMADALKALEIVEGFDESVNQSQSPEKTINKSLLDIPSTATRTSTRRRTTKEPPSTQPTTRTRKMTRITMELDEENKNVNVPDTPIMATSTRRRAQKTESEVEEPKKSDLFETPALQSCRRRPGVGSTRRKVEALEEGSVQQGYGTRRSVRLLEKSMAGLSLKESEIMEPVKIDEMEKDEAEESNGQSEVPLARNLSVSLEDERDPKDDVLENSKCYHIGGNDCTVTSEDNSDAKDTSPNGEPDESHAYLAQSAGKLADMFDGSMDPKGSDYLSVSGDSYAIDNLNEELVAEKNVESHAFAEAFEEISEEALDHSSSAEFMEPIEVVSAEEFAANHAPQEIESQKLVGKDCDINVVMLNDDLAKFPEAEEYDGGKLSQNVSVGNEESVDDPAQIVTGSNIFDAFLGDLDIDDDTGSDNNSLADELQEEDSCEQKSISNPTAAFSSEDPMNNTVNEQALVDVNLAEVEIIQVVESSFHNAPQSVVGDIPITKMLDYGDAEASVDICVKPTEEIPLEDKSPTTATQMSPDCSIISNSAITTSIPLSPMTAQFSQPTRLIPRKSSSMKQTTIPKVIQVSDNNNKENIDNNSSKEVEPNQGKVKKNKNIIDEETMQKLEGMSLRNLKKLNKMFDKLQIIDNLNKEDKNDSKRLGKTRPALQTLAQNCMSIGEAEKQN